MSSYHKRLNLSYDRWLLFSTLTLLCLGLVMVTSSSMVISDWRYHNVFHFFWRQLFYLIVGGTFAWLVLQVKTATWYRCGPYLLLVSLLLLFLVLVPGIGHTVNGSRRWLRLAFFSFQVSELAKLSVILYLAGYLVRREGEVRAKISGFIKPMVLLMIMIGALLLEPDFGASLVIMVTVLGMMFLAGVRLWQFGVLFAIAAVMLIFLAVSAPYRLERLTTFIHPWADQFGSGYQLTQSLMAFGRGGILGVGLGNSVQKQFYLPEAHTDFLFAVIAEELGLIGQCAVLFLFALLVGRTLILGQEAQKQGKLFEAYVSYGLGIYLGLQAMINIGVNLGMLPTKGLTLPLMSYGGSSILVNCMAVSILLRISMEVGVEQPKGRHKNVRVKKKKRWLL